MRLSTCTCMICKSYNQVNRNPKIYVFFYSLKINSYFKLCLIHNVPNTFRKMLIIIPISIMLQYLHLHNIYYLVPVSKQVIWLCFILIHCRSNCRTSWSTTFPETDFYFIIHDQHHMGCTYWHWWWHKRLHCEMAGSKCNIWLNAKSCSTFKFQFSITYCYTIHMVWHSCASLQRRGVWRPLV